MQEISLRNHEQKKTRAWRILDAQLKEEGEGRKKKLTRQTLQLGNEKKKKNSIGNLPVLLTVVFLVLETGTAVTFFFTRNTDLFLGVTLLRPRGDLSSSSERRVLTFPSGRLLLGKFDL